MQANKPNSVPHETLNFEGNLSYNDNNEYVVVHWQNQSQLYKWIIARKGLKNNIKVKFMT